MNKKIEIFKMSIAAGSETFTDEQIQFLVKCLIKTEKLTTTQSSKNNSFKNNSGKYNAQKTVVPKTSITKKINGQSLFMREKMAELKTNGNSYLNNRATATECWKNLSAEEQKTWNDKITEESNI